MKRAKTYILSGDGNKRFLQVIIDVYILRGFMWSTKYALISIGSYLLSPLWNIYYLVRYHTSSLSKKKFLFEDKQYPYFIHPYNYTWRSERAIEIPIIKTYLDNKKGKRMLEVGNVLSHYYKVTHDIVDNYEIAKGVINEDIMKFKPKRNYDMIFSISTLEHVGVDGVREPGKAVKTIKKLQTLLAPRGLLAFTIPLGYNPVLDKAIFNGRLSLSKKYFFKKVSNDNKWIQIEEGRAKSAMYGFPFRWGNVIVVGLVEKK